MSKDKNRKTSKRSEFRTSDKANGHLSYVFRKQDNQLEFLSMTHKPPEETKSNYKPLKRNVNPEDKRPAFINTISDKDHYSNFGSRKKGYGFVEEDKKMVQKIIKKNKKSEK